MAKTKCAWPCPCPCVMWMCIGRVSWRWRWRWRERMATGMWMSIRCEYFDKLPDWTLKHFIWHVVDTMGREGGEVGWGAGGGGVWRRSSRRRFWALCGSMRGILVIYMNTRPFSLPVAVLAISLCTLTASLSLFLSLYLGWEWVYAWACLSVCVSLCVCVCACNPKRKAAFGSTSWRMTD